VTDVPKVQPIAPIVRRVIEGVRMPEASVPPPEVPPIDAAERVAILVGGVIYPTKKNGYAFDPQKYTTYMDMCATYRKHLFQRALATRVLVFDPGSGETRSHVPGGPDKGQVVAPARDPLRKENYRFLSGDKLKRATPADPPSKLYWSGADELARQAGGPESDVPFADYEKARDGGQLKERSFSILDVYATIAASPAKTIHELHFFGHAIGAGPIVVNTAGKNKRLDKDGRPWHFTWAEFQGKSGQAFREAFADEALVMVWGCLFDEAIRKLFVAARAEKTGKVALKKLRDAVAGGFATGLAGASGRSVVSALPPASAVHEPDKAEPVNFQPSLMHVEFRSEGEQRMEFWRSKVGVTFARGGINAGHATYGRGYGTYPLPEVK
jgi:hypothetical protein